MTREPVQSSIIVSVGYDEKKKTLEVEFKNGKIWQYSPITAEGHYALMNADSVGSYFIKHVRENQLVTSVQVK